MGNHCKSLFFEKNSNLNLEIKKKDSRIKNIIIKELDDLKMKIMEIPLFERKEIAEKQYEEYIREKDKIINEKNILKEYIRIINLLFLNNTNKDIVKLYLNFIKNNDDFTKNNELNAYSKEILKYKKIFTKDELYEIDNSFNKESEKKNFINFLRKLYLTDNYDVIIKYVEKEYNSIYFFNYPIEFLNKEIFYYKLYILLIIEIKNNISKNDSEKISYLENKRKIAGLLLKNNVFDNNNIILNENKMNILIILILYDILDDKEESVNFNRLLQTEKVTYKNLIDYVNNNNLSEVYEFKNAPEGEINLKNIYGTNYSINVNSNDVCLRNLSNKNLISSHNPYIFNTLNSLLINNELNSFIPRIRIFLIKIINSKVYQNAIKELFPKHHKYLLGKNLKDLEIFIKERLKFYPYQNLSNSGLTDKFSLYSYIPILSFKIFCQEFFPENFHIFLKVSAVIENTIHEINHINQDIIFFKGNDKRLFNTPKRENLKNKEGGENLEEVLFGKKIKSLKILESLYILNECNYNQNLNEFKKNFENLYNASIKYTEKIKYLKIDQNNGVFHDICINIDNYNEKEIQKIELSGIYAKNKQINLDEIGICIPREHCKIGDYIFN